MKQLQNNFTTPEQSKRLLELGVPADSADMHYHQECVRMRYGKEEFDYFIRYGRPDTHKYSTDIPCWTSGRLMEIIGKTRVDMHSAAFVATPVSDMLLQAIGRLESLVLNRNLDFSKLED